jgi:nucleoside-diphosphate-sugar epimerase
LRAAAEAGIKRVIHISSIAVLSRPRRGEEMGEEAPWEEGSDAGPYVWGKAESERVAAKLAQQLNIDLKIVRPGPIVDNRRLDPPGRLGRRLGNLMVAVGSPRDVLPVIDVDFAARILCWLVDHFETSPDLLNLVDPELPTKGEFLTSLRKQNPGLMTVWLPRVVLAPLSLMANILGGMGVSRSPRNLSAAFASAAVKTKRVRDLASAMKADGSSGPGY